MDFKGIRRRSARRGLGRGLLLLAVVSVFLLFSLLDAMYGFSFERFSLQLALFFTILLLVSTRVDTFSFLFFFIFGVFFVIPFLLFGQEFLTNGTFYEFSVGSDASGRMARFLLTFIVVSTVFQLHRYRKPSLGMSSSRFIYKYGKPFTFIQIFSFAIIVDFNVREALLVWEEGYSSLFSGEFSLKKSVGVFAMEVVFLTCSMVDLIKRRLVGNFLFIVYLLSVVIIGQRMPAILTLLTVAMFLFPRWFNGFRFVWIVILGFGGLVPALQVIAGIRDQGVDVINSTNILETYFDIWTVIGFSADTLKAAFWYEGQIPVDVSPLAKLKLIIQVGLERVFGFDSSWSIGGYGSEFSSQLGPDLFKARSVTFASSGLAESYFFFGDYGSVLYATFCVFTIRMLCYLAGLGGVVATTVMIQFAPRFLGSVRNELFGWLWEAAMVSAFIIFVFYLLLLFRIVECPRKINL